MMLDWAMDVKLDPTDEPNWFMKLASRACMDWASEVDLRHGPDPMFPDLVPEPVELPIDWSCEDADGNEIVESDRQAALAHRAQYTTSWDDDMNYVKTMLSEADATLFEYPHWANVVKVFALKDAKQTRANYKETVAKELGRHMEFSTYGKPVAKSSTPTRSVFYRGKLIYGVKNWETPAEHKDKARLVVQGCLRVTRTGKVLLEKHFKKPGEFWAPNSSMAGFRLVTAVGAIQGLPVQTIDLDSAYLQSYAREEDRYLMFCPEVLESMPDDWQREIQKAVAEDLRLGGSGEVVFPLVKNIYGKSDAGTNFINDFQLTLEKAGWDRLPHCHGTFVRHCKYTGRPMILANYVDDLAVVLTPESDKEVWAEIRNAGWKFDPPKPLEKFLGIVSKTYPEYDHRLLVLEQQDLMKKVVDDYEKTHNVTLRPRITLPTNVPDILDPLDPVWPAKGCRVVEPGYDIAANPHDADSSPSNQEEDDEHMAARAGRGKSPISRDASGYPRCPLEFCNLLAPHLQPDDDPRLPGWVTRLAYLSKANKPLPPGEAGTPMRSAVGALFYGARGTRPDIMKAVHELARRVTKWDPKCVEFLEQLLGYVKGVHLGLVVDARGLPKSLAEWTIDLSTDARYHAPFSTTGIFISIAPCNPHTERFLTLDWTSHAQQYVKLDVASAEVVSAVHGMHCGLRYQASWTLLSGGHWEWCLDGEAPRPCDVMRQRQDNTACIAQLTRGWSSNMSLLPILYGCSSGWACQRIREGRVHLQHEPTAQMLADPLTKLTAPSVFKTRGVLRSL